MQLRSAAQVRTVWLWGKALGHAVPAASAWSARGLLYATACVVAAGELGPADRSIEQLLLLLCLAALAAVEWRGLSPPRVKVPLLLAGFAVVARAPDQLLPAAPLLVALAVSPGPRDRVLTWRLFTLAAFLLLKKLYLFIPAGWYAGEGIASMISSVLSSVSGGPLQLGPSTLGMPGLLLMACMVGVGEVMLHPRRDRWRALLSPALLLVIYAGTGWARVAMPALALPSSVTEWQGNLLLFVPLAAALVPLMPLGEAGEPRSRPEASWRCAAALTAAIAGVAIVSATVAGRPGRPGNLLIFMDGAIPWGMPAPPQAQERLSDGRVGLIDPYLRSLGFRVAWHRGELTRRALERTDVVLVMNLNRFLDERETAALWEFVRRGGTLIACGDHTDYSGLMTAYNRLLAPVGIAFNFDSAVPFAGSDLWRMALAFRPVSFAPSQWIPMDLSISVGASLKVEPPAVPVVVGRYGFSDPGDRARAWIGSLGNLQVDPGERQGDVVLGAVTRYGRGKVLVFGDTSAFMNYSIPSTYQYMASIFTWAADPQARATDGVLVVFLLLGVAAVAGFRRRAPVEHLAVALCAACVILPVTARSAIPYPRTRMLAVVDAAHLEPLPVLRGADSGLAGLNRALMRRGYIPLVMRHWDGRLVSAAKLLVVPGPLCDFTPSEVADLGRASARGAILIVCVGWETAWQTPRLLRHLGVEIGSVPLGSADGTMVSGAPYPVPLHFSSAWPVSAPGYKTVYQAWGHPIVVGGYRGKGRVVVIGDAKFLLGDNLEGDDTLYEGNLWLLNTLAEP